MRLPASMLAAGALTATMAAGAERRPPQAQVIVVPPGRSPQRGPADHFTGTVTVTSPFRGSGRSRVGGATVTFAPGARTDWHSHPIGQLLVVTSGEGRIQDRGGPVRVIRAGDVVWTAPGVEHWHGAAPDRPMTHVAISETGEGDAVRWLEPVPAAAYRGPAVPRAAP